MSTTVNTGWLLDADREKFAPKTLTSQVISPNGTILEDQLNEFSRGANYFVCNTPALDAVKHVSCIEDFKLVEGTEIIVKFTYGSATSNAISLSVNNLPAIPINYRGYASYIILKDASLYTFRYNGNVWDLLGDPIKEYTLNSFNVMATPTELNYCSGAKSNFQKQIDNIEKNIITNDKTVYVSPDGSDTTGDGSETNPWKTISKAIDGAPISRPGKQNNYSINVASGTYTENIQVYERQLQLCLLGNVVIKPTDVNTETFGVHRNARVSILSDSNNKKSLIIEGGKFGFYVNYDSTLIIGNLSDLVFSNITDRCINITHRAYVSVSGIDGNFIVNESCRLSSIVKIENGSHAEFDISWNINSASTCSSYAFASLTNSYLLIKHLTIPNTYAKGIYSIYGAKINLTEVTNNATEPTHTSIGGVING